MKKSTHFSNLRYYDLQCTPNFIVSMQFVSCWNWQKVQLHTIQCNFPWRLLELVTYHDVVVVTTLNHFCFLTLHHNRVKSDTHKPPPAQHLWFIKERIVTKESDAGGAFWTWIVVTSCFDVTGNLLDAIAAGFEQRSPNSTWNWWTKLLASNRTKP